MRKIVMPLLFLLLALAFCSLVIAAYYSDDYSYSLEYQTNGDLHQKMLLHLGDHRHCLEMLHALSSGKLTEIGGQVINQQIVTDQRFVTLKPPSIVFRNQNLAIIHYRRAIAERIAEASLFSNLIILRGNDGFIKHCQAE